MPNYVPCLINSLHQIEYFNIQVFNSVWNTQLSIWFIYIIIAPTTFIYPNTLIP